MYIYIYTYIQVQTPSPRISLGRARPAGRSGTKAIVRLDAYIYIYIESARG